MPRKKIDEWLKPSEALTLFYKTNGGREHLKSEIAGLVRDGSVAITGRVYRHVPGSSAKKAWKTVDERKRPKRRPVSKKLLLASIRWSLDVGDWKWNSSRFSITYSQDPQKRTLIDRARLSSADLNKVLHPRAPIKAGGQKLDLKTWTDFMLASIQCAVDGTLDPLVVKDQSELRAAISERMSGDEFGETHMAAAVSVIWHRFIEPYREEQLIKAGAEVP